MFINIIFIELIYERQGLVLVSHSLAIYIGDKIFIMG